MPLKYLSELVVLPAVDDNVAARVEHQEQVGEVGHQATPPAKTVRDGQKNTTVLEQIFSLCRKLYNLKW